MEFTKQQQITPLEQAILFFELGKPLAKAKSVKETLDAVMYLIGHIFEPVHWSIILKDPKTGDMVFTKVVGSHKKLLEGKRLPRGEGIAGHIFAEGTPLIVSNVTEDPRFSARMDRLINFTTQSIIGVPLKTNDKVFGVIELVNKLNGADFTSLEIQVLSSIAEYAAIAIERTYFNQALKRLALTDALTGLPNKFRLEQLLSNSGDFAKRCQTPVSVMRISLLNAHDIAAREGQAAGDQAIKKLVSMIKETLRDGDTLFRSGFSDFVILMPHTPKAMAEEAGDRIRLIEENQAMETMQNSMMLSVDVHTLTKGKVKDLILNTNIGNGHEKPKQTDLENMGSNLQPMIDEEHQKLQEQSPITTSAKPFGKKVKLFGEFTSFDRKKRGRIKVLEISLKGCGFTLTGQYHVAPEEILDVSFILDDAGKTEIKRRVVIQSIQESLIRAVYYNPPPYDKKLGFYLIS